MSLRWILPSGRTIKRKLVVLGAVVCALAFIKVDPIRGGLIAHWTFDADASDVTGNHSGMLEGGASISGDGGAPAGQALVLDGDGDYVSIPYSSEFELQSGTISFWFRGAPSGPSSQQKNVYSLVDFHHGRGHGAVHGWTVEGVTGPPVDVTDYIDLAPPPAPGSIVRAAGANDLLNDATFHHIVTTFESGANARIFVDGAPVDTASFPGFLYLENQPLLIGRFGAATDEGFPANDRDFKGRIDDVQIYNVSLGAEQVSFLFANPGRVVPIFVDADATGPVHDGTTWSTAFTYLQDALAAAGAGEEIWVANGTYKPTDKSCTSFVDCGGPPNSCPAGVCVWDQPRQQTFQLLNGVALYGGFAGGETSVSQRNAAVNITTLSGDVAGNDTLVSCTQDSPDCDSFGGICEAGFCIIANNGAENSFHVVTGSGTNDTAIVDGFEVTAGKADGINPFDRGAGIYTESGGPTINDCTIVGNSADAFGGGLWNDDGNPTLARCSFVGNSAESAGGLGNAGNGVSVLGNCRFFVNSAGNTLGGGILIGGASSATLANCVFSGNVAMTNGGGVAIVASGSTTLSNCTVGGNSANGFGGGLYHGSTSIITVLSNCILWSNKDDADGSAGGPFMDESAQIHVSQGTPTVNYGIVQGGWSGAGSNNLGVDPLFVDADGLDNIPGTEDDNLRLQPNSPAIDSGDTTALPADAADLDGDMNTLEQIPLDLAGFPRRVDDPFTSDTGVGPAPVVDIGAYEFQGNVLYVDAGATGANNGSSWANAFAFLQNALAYAATHPEITEIWVGNGTYKPTDKSCTTAADCGGAPNTCAMGPGVCLWDQPRVQTFQLLSGVTLYGGFAGGETTVNQRNIAVNETYLSGDLLSNDLLVPCTEHADCDAHGGLCAVYGYCIIAEGNDENSYHVVTGSGTNATAGLDEFTIRDGNADVKGSDFEGGGMYNVGGSPRVSNCTFMANAAGSLGGGMSNSLSSSPTVTSCLFLQNSTAGSGGGISNFINSSPTVVGCTFHENWAAAGGGMFNQDNCNPTVTNCIFDRNVAEFFGAGIQNIVNSTPVITNCTFEANHSKSFGGGMFIDDSNPIVTNCKFIGNRADNLGGGMINSFVSNTQVTNSIFSGNTATNNGGGMWSGASANPTLINCTFSMNSAGNQGGGMWNGGGTPTAMNCVLWNNTDSGGMDESAQVHTSSGTPVVNYSIVRGGWSGVGSNNLNADPLFVDADGPDNIPGTFDDDLRLRAGSPAIDAGNTPALPLDVRDLDGDTNTTERIPLDLAGNLRAYDDAATADTGVPGSPVVDMGAYEFFTDCNNNGVADECDISCSALSGECATYANCGGSTDCDWTGMGGNGTPDECDIDVCDPMDPDCSDCNLNGNPDACDIAAMTSSDLDMDGTPDECSFFDEGCGATPDWSCATNWEDDFVPNNMGMTTFSVTLDATDVVSLDIDVTINSLRIRDDSVLSVTQSGGVGDLTLVAPGGLDLQGTLEVSDSRVVDISAGQVIIGPSGEYRASPIRGIVDAVLLAGNVVVRSGVQTCSPCPDPETDGGAIIAEQSMLVEVTGNLVLDGTTALPCGIACPSCAPRGDPIDPPRLIAKNVSTVQVQSDFELRGSTFVEVEPGATVEVQGDFINQSLYPECFIVDGTLILSNPVLRDATERTFEVAGTDLGFGGAAFMNNFQIGTLEINGQVRFVNQFANTVSSAPGAEALYVSTLILRPGSMAVLDSVKLYYQDLVNEGGTIVDLGLAEQAQCRPYGDVEPPVCPSTAATCVPGQAGDRDVDVDDILLTLDDFSGLIDPPQVADLEPCGGGMGPDGTNGDGDTDVDDILAVLDAFSGITTCPNPCPPP